MHNFGIIIGLTALYFAVILGLVLYSRIKETKSIMPGLNEFFLAGKNLHPLVLAFTYVGSIFSTFSILGMPGLAYAHGISGPGFVFIATIIGCLIILFLGKKLRKYSANKRIYSPIEIFSERYKSRRLGLYMACIFTIFLMPYISLQLVGIGKFLESYTDGQIGYTLGVGSMMAIVLIYLFLGGMRAVAYTDFVQTMAIFLGLIFGLYYFLSSHGLSLSDVITKINAISPDYTSLPGAKGFYTWPMFVTNIVVILAIFIQPHLLTRTMMATSNRDINIIVIATIIGVCLTTSIAFFLGATGQIIYGDTLAPNLMMGSIFKDMGAMGLVGLLLSGLMLMGALGAAMSTADSVLISIGQITTRDAIRPFIRMTPQRQILLSKAIMLVILSLAFFTGLKPPKFMTDLALYSTAGCGLLVPTIIGFNWKKRSLMAAYTSITVGLVALLISVAYKLSIGHDPFGVHVGFLPMALSFILYFGICFATYKKKKKKPVKLAHA